MNEKLNVSCPYFNLIKYSKVLVLKISEGVEFTGGIAIKTKKSQIHLPRINPKYETIDFSVESIW